MKPTPARVIINKLLASQPEQNWLWVFNDKLSDGRRSIKVSDWGTKDYRKAAAMLSKAGMVVEIIPNQMDDLSYYESPCRLHVTE